MDISRETFVEKLNKEFKDIGIDLSDKQSNMFYKYYTHLLKVNEVMNLTAITEADDVIKKHFIDSVSLGQYFDLNKNLKVIDVGTGAGFPGIPLKICYPNLNVLLLDSLNKRIDFLNQTIKMLDLKNIKAIHFRAEDAAHDKNQRENYDLCVSRAVANLSVLSEYCLPFVKVGGSFIPYKSGNIEEETKEAENAINILGGRLDKTQEFSLPNTDYSRSFVFISKIKNTGNKYPRKAGTPKNNPL